MELTISLIIFLLLALLGNNFLKKHAMKLYIVSYIVSLIDIIYNMNFSFDYPLPKFFYPIEHGLSMGALSGAIFIIVMYTGALNPKASYTKKLMSVRAELSIIGAILFLSHTVPYSLEFLQSIPTISVASLSDVFNIGLSLTGIIGFIIMIPLWITSYKKIHKMINAKKWKKIQVHAYIFYLLIYLHVSILTLAIGNPQYAKFALYSVIFVSYFILRVKKTIRQKRSKAENKSKMSLYNKIEENYNNI